MPLRKYSTRHFYRTLIGPPKLKAITILKREDDQLQGIVRAVTVFDCLLPGNEIEGSVVGFSEAYYSGEAVELRTANGTRLRVTTNHPVLTPSGFIKSGRLKPGDQLLVDLGEVGGFAENVQHGPTSIEDVPKTFSELSDAEGVHSSSWTPAALDFYGDGKSMKGDVQIIWPNRELLGNGNLVAAKGGSNCILHRVDAEGSSLVDGNGQPDSFDHGLFASAAGGVGRGNNRGSLLGGHPLPLFPLPISDAAERNPRGRKDLVDRSFGHAVKTTYGLGGFPADVPGDYVLLERVIPGIGVQSRPDPVRFGSGSRFDSGSRQPVFYRRSRDSEFCSDVIQRFPGEVALDDVIHVRRFHYEGPIYDVGTVGGYFTASCEGSKAFCKNCWRDDMAKTGQTLQGDMASDHRTTWHVPYAELARAGINYLSVLDRLVEKTDDGGLPLNPWRFWQAESNTRIEVVSWENFVRLECLRVDPTPTVP